MRGRRTESADKLRNERASRKRLHLLQKRLCNGSYKEKEKAAKLRPMSVDQTVLLLLNLIAIYSCYCHSLNAVSV